MKLSQWFKARSTQEKWMIAFVIVLLVLIATRWAYITHTAGQAIKNRFIPSTEQADSLQER